MSTRGSIRLTQAHSWVQTWLQQKWWVIKGPRCCVSPHQYSKRGGGGLASEEKVIFVLRLLGPILPVHFHGLYRKKCLRRWDKSHQRAFSGPLRASATKGRNPLHFQCDQILQFPIYVLKNLMVTSSTSIHVDGRHSHDKDLLSGRWSLRQAAKRVI